MRSLRRQNRQPSPRSGTLSAIGSKSYDRDATDCKEALPMTRQAKFLWMKDLLEHMGRCQEQWQSADQRMESFLADSLRRDLDEFRRICDSLRHESLDDIEAEVLAGV